MVVVVMAAYQHLNVSLTETHQTRLRTMHKALQPGKLLDKNGENDTSLITLSRQQIFCDDMEMKML